MGTWRSVCDSLHPDCRRSASCPKRLLDVNAFTDSEDIKLVLGKDLAPSTRYVALSHCWGRPSSHPISATRGTLDARKERIRFEDLFLSLQDAVQLCRKLKQQYLWIYQLCIIQDDSDDWIEHATTMATIYKNSYVTLAATSASDSSGGCRTLYDENETDYQDFDFGNERVRIFEYSLNRWHGSFGGPLNRRGWALQEKVLSTRIIEFYENHIQWQCQTTKGTPQNPQHTVGEQRHIECIIKKRQLLTYY